MTGTIWQGLFDLQANGAETLQVQLRRQMVDAILDRRLPRATAVPSPRQLARQLGVARNTVGLVYGQLVEAGLLVAQPRRGFFVAADCAVHRPARPPVPEPPSLDWAGRLTQRPGAQRNLAKPRDWQAFRYPFLYGQFDAGLFPIAAWRACCRQALAVTDIRDWAPDLVDADDPLLVEQIRSRLLPRRGVFARPDEIMVTIGAQHALFLLAELLCGPRTAVGMEDPGYPDARNIFALKAGRVVPLPVDEAGLVPGPGLAACDLLYTTPSHQCPTGATMPLARRQELLRLAEAADLLLIEDDYETELGFVAGQTPALKSLDRAGRVLHVGSLSKTLAPGLRLGFIVAAAPLIREARALRRLMLRHPPANNQRAAALFLEQGHAEALLRRIGSTLAEREAVLRRGLAAHLPALHVSGTAGGSALWLAGPPWLDAARLAEAAMRRGVLVEPGEIFFAGDAGQPPRNMLRLGFSSIPTEMIELGLIELSAAWREVMG